MFDVKQLKTRLEDVAARLPFTVTSRPMMGGHTVYADGAAGQAGAFVETARGAHCAVTKSAQHRSWLRQARMPPMRARMRNRS